MVSLASDEDSKKLQFGAPQVVGSRFKIKLASHRLISPHTHSIWHPTNRNARKIKIRL